MELKENYIRIIKFVNEVICYATNYVVECIILNLTIINIQQGLDDGTYLNELNRSFDIQKTANGY